MYFLSILITRKYFVCKVKADLCCHYRCQPTQLPKVDIHPILLPNMSSRAHQCFVPSTIMATSPPVSLLSLPPELLLEVLQNTTAEALCRCRQVSLVVVEVAVA